MALSKIELLNKVDLRIRANNRQEITGPILNDVLRDIIESCFNDSVSDINFANSNLNFTENRIHNQNGHSVTMNNVGSFSFLGASAMKVGVGSEQLDAKFGIMASSNIKTHRAFGIRNFDNTGWLFETFGSGSSNINGFLNVSNGIEGNSSNLGGTGVYGTSIGGGGRGVVGYTTLENSVGVEGLSYANSGAATGGQFFAHGGGTTENYGILAGADGTGSNYGASLSASGAAANTALMLNANGGTSNTALLSQHGNVVIGYNNVTNQDGQFTVLARSAEDSDRIFGIRNAGNTDWLFETRGSGYSIMNGPLYVAGTLNAINTDEGGTGIYSLSTADYGKAMMLYASMADPTGMEVYSLANSGVARGAAFYVNGTETGEGIGVTVLVGGSGKNTALVLDASNGTSNTAILSRNGNVAIGHNEITNEDGQFTVLARSNDKADRIFGIRDATNTRWLFETMGSGDIKFGGNITIAHLIAQNSDEESISLFGSAYGDNSKGVVGSASGNNGIGVEATTFANAGVAIAGNFLAHGEGADESIGVSSFSDGTGVNYGASFTASGVAANTALLLDASNGTANTAILSKNGNAAFGHNNVINQDGQFTILARSNERTERIFGIRDASNSRWLFETLGSGEVKFSGNLAIDSLSTQTSIAAGSNVIGATGVLGFSNTKDGIAVQGSSQAASGTGKGGSFSAHGNGINYGVEAIAGGGSINYAASFTAAGSSTSTAFALLLDASGGVKNTALLSTNGNVAFGYNNIYNESGQFTITARSSEASDLIFGVMDENNSEWLYELNGAGDVRFSGKLSIASLATDNPADGGTGISGSSRGKDGKGVAGMAYGSNGIGVEGISTADSGIAVGGNFSAQGKKIAQNYGIRSVSEGEGGNCGASLTASGSTQNVALLLNSTGGSANAAIISQNGNAAFGHGGAVNQNGYFTIMGGDSPESRVFGIRDPSNKSWLYELAEDGTAVHRNAAGSPLMQMNAAGAFGIGLNINMTNAGPSDVIVGSGAFVTGGAENRVAIGNSSSVSGNSGIAIGQTATSSSDNGIAIGLGTQSTARGAVAIGTYMHASASYAVMIGGSNNGPVTNSIANSFMVNLSGTTGENYQHFFVNKNTNVVLKSDSSIADDGDFDTEATNAITIHIGQPPARNIKNAYQLYSAAQTQGNAVPHFRTENGRIVKLYQSIQPALKNAAKTGDTNTDQLIEALKAIVVELGLGASA